MEYRFSRSEVRRFLEESGFEPISAHPNDYRPPKNVGLWVDYTNLIFDPYKPPAPHDIFMLPPRLRGVAAAASRRAPWLACGTVTFLARAR